MKKAIILTFHQLGIRQLTCGRRIKRLNERIKRNFIGIALLNENSLNRLNQAEDEQKEYIILFHQVI